MALLRDESKPRTGLLGPQVRRVRPRAEHNVRTYRFLLADTRYIRIWNITYVSYAYTYLVHTPESGKKQTSVYLIKRKIKKKMLVYIYQVREHNL